MTGLSWQAGVCEPLPWAMSGVSPFLLPGGATFLSLTAVTYQARPAAGGAVIVTHEAPVLLTIPAGS